MRAKTTSYDYEASFVRLSSILDQPGISYEEVDQLPPRDKLTFSNGFYGYCTVISIDLRNSSDLPSKMKRPRLARLYRAYISEVVAVMNRDPDAQEINIVGDGAWAVVVTPKKSDINYVFLTACMLNSLMKALNCKLKKRGIATVEAGIGIAYGRALMVKAGLAGSAINEVVYMGDVVNEAFKLASYGNKTSSDRAIMLSSVIHNNLDDHHKGLCTYNFTRSCYGANAVNNAMNDWWDANCT
jgi:class 3 adenylate cyclase